MSLSTELAGVVASDARYTIEAYEFLFASLEHARRLRQKRAGVVGRKGRANRRARLAAATQHVSGQELCLAARDLALSLYGRMALTVLEHWGLRSTADLGNVVYNLIASGDLEKTPDDSRADFDDVYDFETSMRQEFVIDLADLD
jgi:uncharacterized repeat protein (TIGR04138 family)